MAAAKSSEPAEGAPPAGGKKLAGKQIVLFVALPALLLIGGGGTAAVLLMPKGGGEQAAEHGEKKDGHGKKDEKKKADAGKGGHGKEGEGAAAFTVSEGDGVYFLTLPDMLVNITTADGRPAFLKLKLTLEAADEATISAIEPELPRVLDQFSAFLRELRVDDLAGSAGSYRLRVELLRRVNLAVAPAEVNAVLIEEMLIQ